MILFRSISDFVSTELQQKLQMKEHAELFNIFGKVVINAHSLYEWDARGQCNQIGRFQFISVFK